jgi:hypothetical protein
MKFNPKIINVAKNKAKQSLCTYRVSALGFNEKGDLIKTATNSPSCRKNKGNKYHAEMNLIRKSKSIKTIIICRVGGNGDLLPIDPCINCAKVCNDLGIKIYSLK